MCLYIYALYSNILNVIRNIRKSWFLVYFGDCSNSMHNWVQEGLCTRYAVSLSPSAFLKDGLAVFWTGQRS